MFLTTSKKAIAASIAVLSVGGLGLFGGNAISKKTISDSLGDVKLVSIEKTDNFFYSRELFSKFLKNGEPKSKQFKKLFDLLKNEKFSNSSIIHEDVFPVWKKTCEDSSKETYSSWFQKSDDLLLEDVKTVCSLKISQVINSSRGEFNFSSEDSYDPEEKSAWKSSLNILKSSKRSSTADSSLYFSVFGEEEIDDSEEDKNIKKLYRWCREKLNSYYTVFSYTPSIVEMGCTNPQLLNKSH